MKRVIAGLAGALVVAVMPATALAHVTLQPSEAIAGGFQAFVVQVPNERDDAATTKVEVQLPPVFASVSVQPKPGWTYKVEMVTFDEPIEAFGEEVTEGVGSITWSGGEIAPGEFETFPISLGPVPEGELVFPSLQTYSSGEVVRWIGPPDSDEPAPIVSAIDLGLQEGEGQLAALATVREQVEAGGGTDGEDQDDEDGAPILGWIALAVAVLALIVAVARSRPRGA